MSEPVRIAMWSGPRNISTAMMRSFGSRDDCVVSDEPFYGAYLKDTGIQQPMFREIIRSMDTDWYSIARHLNGAAHHKQAIWYQKHMPHHMTGPVSICDFPDHHHAFLIRHPDDVVASYTSKRIEVAADDLGYARQWKYIQFLQDASGETPPIVDSADILAMPDNMLEKLCHAIGISWDINMLNWQCGPRETDGIWAAHWYGAVKETTGFSPPSATKAHLPPELRKIADECREYYDKMRALKIKPTV